jgi:hypothetical protein
LNRMMGRSSKQSVSELPRHVESRNAPPAAAFAPIQPAGLVVDSRG